MHLAAVLERAARRVPHKAALVTDDQTVSYAELLDLARRAATVFREAGLRPGDRVAVMTYNTPGFVVAAFGAWFAGGVLVPVNHKLTVPETRYAVQHSGAVLGVVSGELAATATAAGPDVVWFTTETPAEGLADFDARTREAAPIAGPVSDDDETPAQFLYTSGTTSSPKGCVHTHRTISAVGPLITSTLGFTRDERFLLAMPIWHAAPLNDWLLTMVFLGATTVLQREYDPVGFLRAVERHRVTAFFGAPIAYLAPVQLARAGKLSLSDFDLSSVDKWLYGGAPLGEQVARSLVDAYGTDRFFQVYGMSEMGPVGTALYPEEQLAKAGSIGRGGMPGVDLRVVGTDGKDVAPGGTGEIWLRADTRMQGYHGNEAATADAFAGPWFRTGDVARIDDDGYLFIVDRLKDVIIVGGENVHSQEVEEALRGHGRIADVAVVGRPHPEWGETVVAVCVTSDGADITVEEVRDFLADKVARYKLPRAAVTVAALPRNPSGKLTKHVIREDLAKLAADA
ncbi:class I adenylate-forming enzyme family protein [Actinocorallia sp. A-T 12471]|uniref:class I adenylate-forming enzyme family protein n=1 Tax=Actinocorallia sp. A-T 12471 TaxID=3089813 RepID=UPI0029D3527F|nr:AMP-binding protein [Actinocorallia sp. A-T 12471]MDX6741385.1 AMP-binding protein [Actinocorallia sp. A-T 12471]